MLTFFFTLSSDPSYESDLQVTAPEKVILTHGINKSQKNRFTI